jgi:hypothetical protein
MIACADSGMGFSGEPSAWQGTGGGAGFSFAASRASAAADLGHCVICLDGLGDDIDRSLGLWAPLSPKVRRDFERARARRLPDVPRPSPTRLRD